MAQNGLGGGHGVAFLASIPRGVQPAFFASHGVSLCWLAAGGSMLAKNREYPCRPMPVYLIGPGFFSPPLILGAPRRKAKPMPNNTALFIPIPPNAVLAHYEQITPGSYAVVTASGKVLAPSFFDLREQYTAEAALNGAGCWVVLTPIRSHSFSQETQSALF
jgi:hypothetical protein